MSDATDEDYAIAARWYERIRPAPKPERSLPAKRTPIKKLSAKQRTTREAKGETFLRSTIKPKVSAGFSGERRKKGIKKENPVRKAKRKASYAKKLQAYRRSETYQQVEARAEGRCERVVWYVVDGKKQSIRCGATREDGHKLTHNHLTYARFGGDELPQDVELICEVHNAEYETAKRPWNRGRR